jgi:hypothetical protein
MELHVLKPEDLTFFEANGYIVVPNVISEETRKAVLQACWEFLGMNPNDPTTWYPTDRKGSLVYLHQHQALWDVRQSPRLYGAFVDIYGTEKLWVSMDRATMKPPLDPRYPHYNDQGFVHWDLDTSKPLPTARFVQGVVALEDTTEEMGGFCCIPGFHRGLADWIAEQPADCNPHFPDLDRLPAGMRVTPIPMKAGDLVIWDRLLAHGNGANHGRAPRLAQYVTMYVAQEDNEEARQERIACWRDRHAPSYWEKDIPEHLRGLEKANPPAELTPLGRKLLGLDRWE